LLLGSSGLAQNKKRVAILNFDCGGVHWPSASLLGGDFDVGKAISDLLVAQLSADGKFALIERQALDKVLAEQNFLIATGPILLAPPSWAASQESTRLFWEASPSSVWVTRPRP
jgi:curli biogenesis system outer membrane secretion channel CsgG